MASSPTSGSVRMVSPGERLLTQISVLQAQVNQLRLEASVSRIPVSIACQETNRYQGYGNPNGLPGLPKTRYVPIGEPRRARVPRVQEPVAQPAPIQRNQPSMPMGPDPVLSRRIENMEQRLRTMEQGNRTLIDDMMRIQQELKATVRRNEIAIQEEKEIRTRLEMSNRQSQGKTVEVDDRLRRCEDAVKGCLGNVEQMSVHLGSVERMVSSVQQEQMNKGHDSTAKIQEFRTELLRISQSNEQLDRFINNIREESRSTNGKLESLQQEIITLQTSLKVQARMIEDSSKNVPRVTGKGLDPSLIDNVTANTDSRIGQMNSLIQKLNERVTEETRRREKIEQTLKNKIDEIMQETTSIRFETENEKQKYDGIINNSKPGMSEGEKNRIMVHISSVNKDLSKKINLVDAKLREETVDKLNDLESSLDEETERRQQVERDLNKKIEAMAEEVLIATSEETGSLKKSVEDRIRQNQEHFSETNRRVEEAVNSFLEDIQEHERVLATEISERQTSHKVLEGRMSDLEQNVGLQVKSLKSRVSESKKSSGKLPPMTANPDMSEVHKLQAQNNQGIRREFAKEIGDIDKRVTAIEKDLDHRDEIIQRQLDSMQSNEKDANFVVVDKMSQQVEEISMKQSKLKKQVEKLDQQITTTPKELESLKDETSRNIGSIKKELDKEKKERTESVTDLNANINRIMGPKGKSVPDLTTLSERVEVTQNGLNKCAESLHSAKTNLTKKIETEKKIREQESTIFNSDIDRLEAKMKDVKDRIKASKAGLNDTSDLDDFL